MLYREDLTEDAARGCGECGEKHELQGLAPPCCKDEGTLLVAFRPETGAIETYCPKCKKPCFAVLVASRPS